MLVHEIADLDASVDAGRHPLLAEPRSYAIVLEPGELVFVPLAWWRRLTALEFSVTRPSPTSLAE